MRRETYPSTLLCVAALLVLRFANEEIKTGEPPKRARPFELRGVKTI